VQSADLERHRWNTAKSLGQNDHIFVKQKRITKKDLKELSDLMAGRTEKILLLSAIQLTVKVTKKAVPNAPISNPRTDSNLGRGFQGGQLQLPKLATQG
jgi:hypothetical protein